MPVHKQELEAAEGEKRQQEEQENERVQAEEYARQEALAERLRQIEFQQLQQTHPHMAQQVRSNVDKLTPKLSHLLQS
jgi:hypothetical protein